MLREQWEFEYTASKLIEAAAGQRAFRDSRVSLWKGKKEEVIAKIKESGITIDESIADELSNSMKYGSTYAERGARILVDPTMQLDLNECQEKIRKHTQLRDQYAAWIEVLSANTEARLKLDREDWSFFFGK